ncbi:tautomerase family protein [Paenibacillus sp. WLX1005]|uniref:tautomerase family protein n=1 Tax=unclassified Paenibacillus TaxID=185978 RepID=UPI00398446F4
MERKVSMPFITIKVLEGRSVEQKRELVQKMSDLVSDVLELDKEKIFIFFEDLPQHNYGRNGELFSDSIAAKQQDDSQDK